jgi:hypothetical protein
MGAVMSTPHYRCDSCGSTTTDPIEMRETEHYCMGDATVSQVGIYLACDVRGCKGECEEIHVCDVCDTREAAEGADQCVNCISDAVVADPRELDTIFGSLKDAVTKELARRARPYLTMRQAS